jgi:hypothetical protein
MASQNVVLYAVEGLREVTASVMAGLAFVSTGNLAAPLAGSVVVQVRAGALAGAGQWAVDFSFFDKEGGYVQVDGWVGC